MNIFIKSYTYAAMYHPNILVHVLMTIYFSAPSFLSSVFLGDIEFHVDPAVPFHPKHAAIFTP